MPAPTIVQVGLDFLYKFGGTAIGGRRGGALRLTQETIDTTSASSGRWRSLLGNTRAWDLSLDGLFLEGASPAAISGYGGALGVYDDVSAYDDLPALRSLSFSLSMETIETTNQDSSKARSILPSTRSMTISAEADYIDPAGASGTALDALLDAYEAGTAKQVKVSWGGEGSQIVASVFVTSFEVSHPHDGKAVVSLTLEVSGEPTDTFTNVDTGLNALLSAFFSATPGTVAGIAETATSGATKLSGTAYPTALEISIPFDDAVSVTGTLTGTGALTRGTTT